MIRERAGIQKTKKIINPNVFESDSDRNMVDDILCKCPFDLLFAGYSFIIIKVI